MNTPADVASSGALFCFDTVFDKRGGTGKWGMTAPHGRRREVVHSVCDAIT